MFEARRGLSLVVFAGALSAGCASTVLVPGEDGDSVGSTGAGNLAGGGAGSPSGGNDNGSGAGAGNGSGAGSGSGSGSASGGGSKSDDWARAFGTDGAQHLHALASDASGALFVAGDYGGDLDFGGGALATAGFRSSYVAKLDKTGKVLWKHALIADDCVATALALGAGGEVYLTGSLRGALQFDGEEIAQSDGVFLVALDPSGDLDWAKTFGVAADMETGLSVAPSPGGGVVMSGTYQGSIDFGGGPLTGGGVFVASFGAKGEHLFSQPFPGLGAMVAVDSAGLVYVGENRAGDQVVVTSLDQGGATRWSVIDSPASFRAAATGGSGALFAGITTGAKFGGNGLANQLPSGEGFVVSFDAEGGVSFLHGLHLGDRQSVGAALSVDAGGAPLVTGSYELAMSSGGVMQSAFAVGLDASTGKETFSHTFGPTDGDGLTQEGWGIAPAPSGGVYLGGDFYSAIHVAGEDLDGDGSSDVFVARFKP